VAGHSEPTGYLCDRMPPVCYLLDCFNSKFLGISLPTHDTPLKA
jgi:hypothetical protein